MLKTGDFICIDPKTQRFIHRETGDFYLAIGCNYFPKGTGWAPKLWSKSMIEDYKRDFPRIRNLNLNTIRVFLSLNTLMTGPNTFNETTFTYIRDLLDMAQQYDLRIIFSGPSAWDGTPEWAPILKESWNEYFSDDFILEQLEACWKEIANTCKDYPSLFSYELFNEPYIEWDTPNRLNMWTQHIRSLLNTETDPYKICLLKQYETTLPQDHNSENIDILFIYQMFKNEISRKYSKACVDAIRSKDQNHMVTVGCHQCTVPFEMGVPSRYFGFDPHYVGDLFDYISIHYYPYDDRMEVIDSEENFRKNLNLISAFIRYMDIGKPVVLEEFGLYGGGTAPSFPWRKPFKYHPQELQTRWVSSVMKENIGWCSGFLNWGFDDHPDWKDVTRYQGFFDDFGEIKNLGKAMPSLVDYCTEYVIQHPEYKKNSKIKINLRDIVTSPTVSIGYAHFIMEQWHTLQDPYFSVKNP